MGYAYVYKEVYESDHIISAAAKKLVDLTTKKERINLSYGPPDLWNRRQDTGLSAAEIFQNNGVVLHKAGNDRIAGWLAMKEWLAPFETLDEQTGEKITIARLRFFDNCKNAIRTIPSVLKDEKDPNDVATEPHELTHAPDSIRYFCVMRTLPTKVEVPEAKPLPFPFRTEEIYSGGFQEW
jgi:phage terminase large subunit